MNEQAPKALKPGQNNVAPVRAGAAPQQGNGDGEAEVGSGTLWARVRAFWVRRQMVVLAAVALGGIAAHLVMRFAVGTEAASFNIPLFAVLVIGGVPLVLELAIKLVKLEFGSDLLAGISIVTAAILGEYLAGALVVLMLSGGGALESFAVASASSVLRALAKRMPAIAHRKQADGMVDVPLADIAIGDTLVLFPHDICPVDGVVTEGHGAMNEAFLTGEPFVMSKAPGSAVISGAINGESALTIRTVRPAAESRYAKIMQVMKTTEENRPKLRRLGDTLGAYYTPLAVVIALVAWAISGSSTRFLAVLVVATPCPLLIAIPVAIIGAISLCARRSIIIKNPVVLEQIATCRTAIFDKTGTLTYGRPKLTEQVAASGGAAIEGPKLLTLVASLERYSKHPLAKAIVDAAVEAKLTLLDATDISEPPGQGLAGNVGGHSVRITSRGAITSAKTPGYENLPEHGGGLECFVVLDNRYAATLRFRDEPRAEGMSFIRHLKPKHHFEHVMIVSGDREAEVRYLASKVGITEVFAEQSPEQKVEIVRSEAAKARTLYVGDGINDAPALMAATVGIAIGQNSDITTEAAGVVIMDSSLERVDEFMHISRRMRVIALQSAIGGMALSVVGMLLASGGLLAPVAGAVAQEVIDVLAVLNALRAAMKPKQLSDIAVPPAPIASEAGTAQNGSTIAPTLVPTVSTVEPKPLPASISTTPPNVAPR